MNTKTKQFRAFSAGIPGNEENGGRVPRDLAMGLVGIKSHGRGRHGIKTT